MDIAKENLNHGKDNELKKKYTPFEATELNSSELRIVLEEIGETEETRVECLKELRSKLCELDDLHPCLDEEFLLPFLRVSKYNTSKAYNRLCKYYKQQEKYPDIFKNCSLSPSKAKSIGHLWGLPYRLEDNSVAVINRGGAVNYSKILYGERFYLELISLTHFLENPLNQLCGLTLILDYNGFNYRSVLAHTPGWILLFVETFQSTFPIRCKAIHIVNAPSIFTAVFKLCYPVLSKKLQNRLFLHPKNDEWKSLHSRISPEILPKEYGGKLEQSCLIDILEDPEQLERQFIKQFKYGYLRSKQRLQSPFTDFMI